MVNMEKIDCDIVVIIHRIFTEGKRKLGGVDKIIDFFSQQNKTVLLIEHPLKGLLESNDQSWNGVIISIFKNGTIKELERIKTKKNNIIMDWLNEVDFNISYIKRKIRGRPVLISSDPLNSIPGLLYGAKFVKRYYHCVDYSKKRFDNFFLNLSYMFILRAALKFYDYVGVNSLRTKKEIENLGCATKKIILIPNSPVFKKINIDKKDRHTLVYSSGAVIDKYNYEFLVKILFEVKKYFPDIKLYAIGGIEQDPKYVNKIKSQIKDCQLNSNVIFTGFITQKELELYLIRAKVGISFYSKKTQYYTYFGDSLKIREYALYGIPTISDGNCATDEEMERVGAGFTIRNANDAVQKIKSLLKDDKLYANYQNNCVEWAKKTDKSAILHNLFTKLYNNFCQ